MATKKEGRGDGDLSGPGGRVEKSPGTAPLEAQQGNVKEPQERLWLETQARRILTEWRGERGWGGIQCMFSTFNMHEALGPVHSAKENKIK